MESQTDIDEQQVEYEIFKIDYFQSEVDRYTEFEEDMA